MLKPVRGICILLSCFLLFIINSCARHTNSERYDKPVNTDRRISLTNMNADIIDLVNQCRKSRGLAPLKVLPMASIEAANHSLDMAMKKVPFGHDGFKQRAIVLADQLHGSSATGENVAYGKMTAKEVVAAWLRSAAHRANLEGDFTYTGVGVAKDNRGVVYYTELFVKK